MTQLAGLANIYFRHVLGYLSYEVTWMQLGKVHIRVSYMKRLN